MKRLFTIVTLLSVLVAGFSLTAFFADRHSGDRSGEYAVTLNEIENLIKQGETDRAAELAGELRADIRAGSAVRTNYAVLISGGVCIIFMFAAAGYFSRAVILPFNKLSGFAERVALGDLETPLEYDRGSYFGKFSWAFDSMRSEILKARACEREAIENNKTVIASLSHDIKTPVASIRAYAEALELGMDGDREKRQKYISVMLKKCDEVSALTEDMLTHSLSDLGKLKMNAEDIELTSFMEQVLDELDAGRGDIRYEKPAGEISISADRMRLSQLAENLINNARKYAKTDIKVSVTRNDDMVQLRFRDYGKGIPDKDMPFIWGKFYRGSNCSDEKGAGLGLFIVRYIAEQSDGRASLRNCGGLEVMVELPVKK